MIYLYTLDKRIPFVARKLARKLNTKILRPRIVPTCLKKGDVIFNYGASTPPKWSNLITFMEVKFINHWDRVKLCVNKIDSLTILEKANVPTLKFTTVMSEAQNYDRVVVRKLVCSTKAKGIVVIDNTGGTVLPEAPLYTEYYRKTHEFRVHVFGGQVIDYTQKKLLSKEKREARNIPDSKYIRSYDKGWIFSRHNIVESSTVRKLAIDATAALGLDFAAVDILANVSKDGPVTDAVVCEANSAPGMVNTTFKNYLNTLQLIKHKDAA